VGSVEATGPEVQVLAEVGLRTQQEHPAPVEQEAEAEQEVRVVKVKPVGWGVVVKLEGPEGKVVPVAQGVAEVPGRQEGQ
jgi:hypothetical protein